MTNKFTIKIMLIIYRFNFYFHLYQRTFLVGFLDFQDLPVGSGSQNFNQGCFICTHTLIKKIVKSLR